jgi:hypothetical protein
MRSAASTVDSTIGQLRAIFRDGGRGKDWLELFGLGNPAASPAVKKHLKAVKLEQASALVSKKRAVPLLFDKLQGLCRFIEFKLNLRRVSGMGRYVLMRDKAYFKLICHTGDRGGDLGLVQTREIKSSEVDPSIWVFNHTLGKTLKGDHTNMFFLRRSQDPTLCPLRDIEQYITKSRTLGI